MMTDLFMVGGWGWFIPQALAGGWLGWLISDWREERRAGRKFIPARNMAKINTVWDEEGKVVYDHPIRGQGARAFYRLTRSLMAKPVFLAPFVYPQRPENEQR